MVVTLRKGASCIEAVTFDLWQTLLLEKDGWEARRTNARCGNLIKVFENLGVKVTLEHMEAVFDQLKSWLMNIWNVDKEVAHLDQIHFLLNAVTRGATMAKEEWTSQLSSAAIAAFFEVPPYLNPDAGRIFRWLKDKRKHIGLICNVGLTPGFALREFLRREDVADFFDIMLFSDDVGIRKPSPRIFEMAIQHFEVEPHKIVHIGDNLKGDVWGAKNAGLKAIYLLTDVGRDGIAETDPESLFSYSKRLGNLKREQIVPDKTITSLGMLIDAIEELG